MTLLNIALLPNLNKFQSLKTPTSLYFYSYDSVNNPWLGGGGAYRDVEILQRLSSQFSKVFLQVGSFPKAQAVNTGNIHIRHLGFGKSEISSRISYFFSANFKMLFQKPGVIGFNISPYSPFISWMVKKYPHYGIVHHVIGENWKKKMGVLGMFPMRLETWLVKKVKNLVAVNPGVADWAGSLGTTKNIFLSANGFSPDLLDVEDRTDYKKPFLLFVGRLDVYMKGLDILLDAFIKARQRVPEIKLVLAGKAVASSETKINELCGEKNLMDSVQIITNISEAKKRTLLSECMFFVTPSRFEGWGIAALEANAAGKTVVASDAEGFKISLKDGYSAVLVNVGDVNELSYQIVNLLENSEKLKEMNIKARQWARKFSWDEIAQKEWDWINKTVVGEKSEND